MTRRKGALKMKAKMRRMKKMAKMTMKLTMVESAQD
jgi:hypothetical protein